MKTYFISRKDGGVSVMRIYSENTVEEEIQKWHEDDQANVESVVEASEDKVLPLDEFRDAWTLNGKDIGYDLEKARGLQLERIRVARAPLLAALDIEYQRADEENDAEQKQAIAARKKELRDCTEELKALELTSLDYIRDAYPEILREEENGQG